MAFLASPFGLGVSITAILIGAIIFAKKKPRFPIINKYPKDYFRGQAHHEYKTNTRNLLKEGAAKYGDEPFTILVPNGIKTILPPSCVGWAKNNRDLDHQQLVRDEYFASYPGFEVQHVLHHPNRMVINMVQGNLSKTDKTLPVMIEHINAGLSDIWGEDKSWKTINWEDGTTGVISRAAASIFVGPELAADPEWQRVSRAYVLDYFGAVGEMHLWPSWLRWLVVWYLPGPAACRAGLKRAREMVNKVVQKRRQGEKEAKLKGEEPPAYYDALAWTLESPLGNEFEPADVQLALAMAALFTTSELFRQILIEIARRPEVVEHLRREIEDAAPDHDFTATSLVKMQLLDSFMKETQRQIPSQGKYYLQEAFTLTNSFKSYWRDWSSVTPGFPMALFSKKEPTSPSILERCTTPPSLRTLKSSTRGAFINADKLATTQACSCSQARSMLNSAWANTCALEGSLLAAS
jgi:hypothetical protein